MLAQTLMLARTNQGGSDRGSARVLGLFLAFSLVGPALAQEDQPARQPLTLDQLLEQKVSAAAKYEQTVEQAPASVTIVTAEEIERFGFRTLGEVLDTVRDFYTSYDRNYEYVGVRGFSRPTDYNNRILLLIDGHTLNEDVYGSSSMGTDLALPLEAFERIEIVRGPGSALYGTSAMLAVVNLVTRSGAGKGVRVSAEAGSFGRLGATLLAGTAVGASGGLLVSGTWSDVKGQNLYFPEYDTPATNHGVAVDLDADRSSGILASLKMAGFSLLAAATTREKAIPTGAFGMAFNAPGAQTRDDWQLLDAAYDGALDYDKSVRVRLYADHYQYRGRYPYETLSTDGSDGSRIGGEAQLRWDTSQGNRLTIGTEYRHAFRSTYFEDYGSETLFDGNFPFSVFSLYLQDELQASRNLTLTVGLRYDDHTHSPSSLVPRLAAVFRLPRSGAVKLLYGEAFRAPNTYEVHYEDPISGAEGNPALDPEKIRTLELVVEERLTGWLYGTASIYRYEMRDLIEQVTDPADGLLQFRNLQRVSANGISVEGVGRWASGLSARLSYSLQRAEDDAGTTLTNSPQQLVKAGLGARPLPWLDVGLLGRYESSRKTVYTTSTGPFAVFDATITASLFSDRLSVSLAARNLLDRKYATPGGFEHMQPAIPQDGRNVIVRTRYAF